MSRTAFRVATALTRAWTRLYTAGLPAGARERRREEIDADLWALEHDAGAGGFAAAHVVVRLMLGIADDVEWRMEQHTFRRIALGSTLVLATVVIVLSVIASETLRPPVLPHVNPAPPLEVLTLVKRKVPAPPPRPEGQPDRIHEPAR